MQMKGDKNSKKLYRKDLQSISSIILDIMYESL